MDSLLGIADEKIKDCNKVWKCLGFATFLEGCLIEFVLTLTEMFP
jgi:hypothetical protein